MTAVSELIDLFRAYLRSWLAAGLLVVAASAAAQWQVRAVPGAAGIGLPVGALRDGQAVVYAPRYSEITDGGLAWSSDLGRTWTPQPFVRSDGSEIAPANTWVYDIKVAPQGSATLYAFLERTQSGLGLTCRLIKSTDGGVTWSSLADNVYACLLVLDPTDPLRMYAIDLSVEPNPATLVQSVDGGKTWSYVTGIGAQAKRAAVAGDGQVYVASGAGLFVSNGRGGSWQQIMTGDVRDVVAEPWSAAPGVFVTTAADGVYVVRNRVATLLAFPGIQVLWLSLVPDLATNTSRVFVGYRAGLALNQPPSTVMTSFSNGLSDNVNVYGVGRVSSAANGAAWIAIGSGGLAVCQAACEGGRLPAIVDVIEFFNTGLNHYFLTANVQEAQQIDAGAAGPGWTRTNRSFKAYQGIVGSPSSSAVVCRFYGTPGRGPNSHFYTAFAGECAGVQQDPGWRLEDPEAFAIFIPNAVSPCDLPVYRAYNNRAAFNDSNHRYMTERSDYDAMVAAGWIGEGPVFCGLP